MSKLICCYKNCESVILYNSKYSRKLKNRNPKYDDLVYFCEKHYKTMHTKRDLYKIWNKLPNFAELLKAADMSEVRKILCSDRFNLIILNRLLIGLNQIILLRKDYRNSLKDNLRGKRHDDYLLKLENISKEIEEVIRMMNLTKC